MPSSSGVNLIVLGRRLDSCRHRYSNEEDIVEHLRTAYPEYRRIKRPPFTNAVRRVLGQPSSRNFKRKQSSGDDNDNEDELTRSTSPRKKSKRADERSEGSCVEGDDECEEIDRMSPSEGGVDLIKSMLRASYSESKPPENINPPCINNCRSDNKKWPMFSDIGGTDLQGKLKKIEVLVKTACYYPKIFDVLGGGHYKPLTGILLHGPPGSGKTMVARAIANETGLAFHHVSASELVSGITGQSEENILSLFMNARRTAPSVLFIDDIDAIASTYENQQKGMERRILRQLNACIDESHSPKQPTANADSENSDPNSGYVLVIGATSTPDTIDQSLRSRLRKEIPLSLPDENLRLDILSKLSRNLKQQGGSFDLLKIARSTSGFVGADLDSLVHESILCAVARIMEKRLLESSQRWKQQWSPEDMAKHSITMSDFEEALENIKPSSKREWFSSVPNVTWEDIGGLDDLREELDFHIVGRIKSPEDYEKAKLGTETGFLFFGPPGCGKTLIAKAVAHEAGANFIHIKGPELLNKFVGESERTVRTIFADARAHSPCIIFFDEVDSLAKQRGADDRGVADSVLTQLLVELDGGDNRKGVIVIGATNRIDVMDRAMLRPGRFSKLHYVRLPNPDARSSILRALGRTRPIGADVDLDALGRSKACENLSCADLTELMKEAVACALKEHRKASNGTNHHVEWNAKMVHFEQALGRISPSVSMKDIRRYDKLAEEFNAK